MRRSTTRGDQGGAGSGAKLGLRWWIDVTMLRGNDRSRCLMWIEGRPHQTHTESSTSTEPGLISNAMAQFPHGVWTILLSLVFCQLCSHIFPHALPLFSKFPGSAPAPAGTLRFPPSPSLPSNILFSMNEILLSAKTLPSLYFLLKPSSLVPPQ